MDRASRMAASTGKPPNRRCSCWPMPLRRDGIWSTEKVRPNRASPVERDRGDAPVPPSPTRSATPADALDPAIKRGVLFVHYTVWIAEILFRRHLIGARLPVADRSVAHRLRLARPACSA